MTYDSVNNSNLEEISLENKGQKVTDTNFTVLNISADNFNDEDNTTICNINASIMIDTIKYETNSCEDDTKTKLCIPNENFTQEKENLCAEDIKPPAASTCAEKVQSILEMLVTDSLNKASNFAD
ncbi:hypothetical protein COBT_004225, partial [Conglomerata obtusa]